MSCKSFKLNKQLIDYSYLFLFTTLYTLMLTIIVNVFTYSPKSVIYLLLGSRHNVIWYKITQVIFLARLDNKYI